MPKRYIFTIAIIALLCLVTEWMLTSYVPRKFVYLWNRKDDMLEQTAVMKKSASQPTILTQDSKVNNTKISRRLRKEPLPDEHHQNDRIQPEESDHNNNVQFTKTENRTNRTYMIHWYNPPTYLKVRHEAFNTNFEKCRYSNCMLTKDKNDRERSDLILFDGRLVPKFPDFKRPLGQIWVFAAHESPASFNDMGKPWNKEPWRNAFNWTMTYDKDNADIFLPYGELRKYKKPVNRNYIALANQKNLGALIIVSHCKTRSYRYPYVKKLSEFVPVEVLGSCGKPWKCGKRYVHDECFNILNTTYKFYLAFENAFCHQYYTEKFYDNFNYDIIMVVRGGSFQEAKSAFPDQTVISTDDFETIQDLGRFLNRLMHSAEDYAEMLRVKSQYYSVGYTAVYQRALCDICERINNLNEYAKTIPDIVQWAYASTPCRNATDLE